MNPSAHRPDGPAQAGPQVPRCVLYVEDQPVNVMLMQAAFGRRPDYRLVVATDGASGLRAAAQFKPELLMLDIGLPDCDGGDLLRQLRQIDSCRNVPAVAVTADHLYDIAGSSFCERWNKPVPVADMLCKLDRFLREPENA
ncbi:MAG TPA: response regulator [Rubrivivax sp.]